MTHKIGDTCIVNYPGSWLHGKLVVITSDLCDGPEIEEGHWIRVPGEGISHIEAEYLEAQDD